MDGFIPNAVTMAQRARCVRSRNEEGDIRHLSGIYQANVNQTKKEYL